MLCSGTGLTEIVYGVTDDVHVTTVVKNTGENAYLANMKINISSDLSIIGVDINGVNNNITLINIDKLVVLKFNSFTAEADII